MSIITSVTILTNLHIFSILRTDKNIDLTSYSPFKNVHEHILLENFKQCDSWLE